MPGRLCAALCLTTATVCLAAAGRGPGKLAVVDVSTPPAMLGLGQQITQAVLAEAKAQGYTLVTPDDIVATLGPKPYEELEACLGRAECVSRKLEPLGVDRAVMGQLARDEKNYIVRLWLIDVHSHSVIADVDRSTLIAARRLQADVKLAVPDLLHGKREARGTLRITSNAKGAIVTVDGELTGRTPVDVELKPGKHEVKLEKKSYLPVTRLVTVAPNVVTEEELRMLLIPGEKPEEEELPALAQGGGTAGTVHAESGFKIPPAAWVAGGFAVVAVGVGASFGYAAQHNQQQLTTGYNAAGGYYAGTRAQALAGKQDAIFANIGYAAAGAGVVTAGLLIAVGQGSDSVEVKPTAGPGTAGVLIQGRF